MTGERDRLKAHLEQGFSTVARAWAITRHDGVTLGFTDHDAPLNFEGISFRPDSGMTARALAQTTGLSVDNTEAMGALSSEAITEADIQAGRYDGAELRAWTVNWADPQARALVFRGFLGELTRQGGAFEAELRGLSEAFGDAVGRVYHPQCSAVLGDACCGFDTTQNGYTVDLAVQRVEDNLRFVWTDVDGFEDRWFERGRLQVLSGEAAGLNGHIKRDRVSGGGLREVELWQSIRADLHTGDRVRLFAGCDKRAETCRLKFDNFLNFRGFPHLPGEDWLLSYPDATGSHDGGSLSR
ncbi:DUF2163 domain-containing protein [Rhodobacteraceae bacterium]|nr:DUF2163 domain-containing protein [Paracoccaceae bacterium]